MNEPEVFVLADRALNRVVGQIKDDQWETTLPESFRTRRMDHTPTLREIVNYHAYDDAWVPDMLAGRMIEEAGAEKFKGDLLGVNPQGSFLAIVEEACAAAQAFEDLNQTVHCSFGDYPARHYFWQINQFRALRAHDIAKMIGADPTLPEDLGRPQRRGVARDRHLPGRHPGCRGGPPAGSAARVDRARALGRLTRREPLSDRAGG